MAVPQSVSFAAMAGLPAAYGLYTAFIPVFAYSIMGSSRHLVSRITTTTSRLFDHQSHNVCSKGCCRSIPFGSCLYMVVCMVMCKYPCCM